ncbi:MAG: efflux RND transporter periplasmic adaptor subunit [Candidatus Solibacter usitatus]|nr:efflux RND transporter periplasmic adaptor subunit [Candidatus Solibacter usitatus]
MKQLLALLCCGLTLFLSCGKQNETTAAAPPAAPGPTGLVVIPADSPKLKQLRVETVRSAQIPTDEVVSPGKVEVNPNRVSSVGLPVPGRIVTVQVRLGDAVEQGQVLLTVESPDADAAESAYLQAIAALTQAKAGLVKAQSDFDRVTDLFQHNAVAKKEVINADNALAQAKAALEQSEAAREQSIRRLAILGLKPGAFGQKIEVRAPLGGKVLEMSVAAGEYRNDTSAPLIKLADLSTVWVAADVPESSIRLIQINEPVDITLSAYPGETFHGRVARIADTVDPQTRTIKVRVEMQNTRGRFRPEMFANIRHVESTMIKPVLPPGAVIQGDGHSVVFLEQSAGSFLQTEVTLGKRFGEVVPVLSGLKAGDRVVVDGAMLLK